MAPLEWTTTSFGEFSSSPSNSWAMISRSPSGLSRTRQLVTCSQTSRLRSASYVMPLHLFAKFFTSTTPPSALHLPADIAGHVAEQQMVLGRMPDRAFREREAGRQLLDLDVRIDELVQFVGLDVNGHVRSFPRVNRNGANLTENA